MKIIHIVLKFILICYALIYLHGANLPAQEKQIQYKLKVEVKLLYVLAVDKDGNPVTDLQKEDFTLFVDGQPQEIESFSLISHTAEKAGAEPEKYAAEKFDIEDISPEEVRGNKRFILVAVPQSFESLSHLNRVKKALTHLIEHARYPEDWIGIVAIHGDWIGTIQDFTSSREKLLQKIDAYFSFDREKLNSLESQYPVTAEEIYQVPQLPIFQGVIPVRGGMDIIPALNILAERMGVLEGRKIIFCFGLPLRVFGIMGMIIREFSTRFWSFLEMIDKVLSHNITIYYTELERPSIPDFFDASSAIKLDSILLPGAEIYHTELLAALSSLRFFHESTHFMLANETGGKYYYNITSPTYCIDDVDNINSSYYLISFTISEELRKKKSHTIRLECKRKGVKLFYGNKYYAPEELEEKKFEEIYKRTQLYIRSPEQLFGVENTSRKLVAMSHELITIKLRKTIPDLSELARRIKEAEYNPEHNRGVIVKTPWGVILVHAKLVQLQQIRDLSKVNILATFLYQVLHSDREMSFVDWVRGFPGQEKGPSEDFIFNIEKTKEELT